MSVPGSEVLLGDGGAGGGGGGAGSRGDRRAARPADRWCRSARPAGSCMVPTGGGLSNLAARALTLGFCPRGALLASVTPLRSAGSESRAAFWEHVGVCLAAVVYPGDVLSKCVSAPESTAVFLVLAKIAPLANDTTRHDVCNEREPMGGSPALTATVQ